MLDPQYLQDSEETEDDLSADSIKNESLGSPPPIVFGMPISPQSENETSDQSKKKESTLTNATKICLKFQLSGATSQPNQGKSSLVLHIRLSGTFCLLP